MHAHGNTENIARLRPISNTPFGLVRYGTQKHYIFLYSTHACVITYILLTLSTPPPPKGTLEGLHGGYTISQNICGISF